MTPSGRDQLPLEPDPIRHLVDERVPWAVHGAVYSYQSLGIGPVLAQGWKLHVSATQVSAVEVLDMALAVLLDEGARFKVVNSVRLLTILNSGHLGLSQIGKYITVYPSDDGQAVRVAIALDAATRGLSGPRVPTDRPLKPQSLVHYRYGAMQPEHDIAAAPQDAIGAYDLLDAGGRLTRDVRLNYYVPPPPEIVDPFEKAGAVVSRPVRSPLLNGQYLVVGALAQGVRGGVFRAIDLTVTPARFCLVKEAWHDVAVDELGRDARAWLVNEEEILVRHQSSSLLPRLYGSFNLDDNRYIAIEYIEGRTLSQVLLEGHLPRGGIDIAQIVEAGRSTAAALADLHENGLVFRDFSPANVIVTARGDYRLIDFGHAYDLADPSVAPISGGTPPFYSREQFDGEPPAPADDIFAWGAVLHYLCCGEASLPDRGEADYGLRPFPRRPVQELRPDAPQPLAAVIDRAVAWEPRERFETMREAHRAFVRASDQLRTVAFGVKGDGAKKTPAAEAGESRAEIGRSRWIQLACEVGDALCAEAEEREGGLCWAARDSLRGSVTYGPDLYSGAAGIGLFLAELAYATGAPRYAEVARGAARWLAGPTWSRGRAQHGLYCGEPGVCHFFIRLAELLGEPGFVTAAELRMRRLEHAPFLTTDLTDGAAGTIVVLVELYRRTGESSYLAAARAAGDELVRAALPIRDGSGLYWAVSLPVRGAPGRPYLGLLHGVAGIGMALANLASASGEERYLETAHGAASLLLAEGRTARAVALNDGDVDDTGLMWARELGDREPSVQAHCHGAGGIAEFFLYLDHLAADTRYKETAKRAARTILARASDEASSSICHGLAGSGQLMLDCFQAFGDRRWLEAAIECAIGLERFRDPKRAGVYRMRRRDAVARDDAIASPDLMLGYAGAASLSLRLADPAVTPQIILSVFR